MARWLYTLVYYLLLPLILLRLLWRATKAPAYRRRVAERFGYFPSPGLRNAIWVHSVSVGETIAAAPLIRLLQERHPQRPLVVTTMTPTGSERVKALFGETVFHVYAPYDLPGAIGRFIKRVDPALLVIMETELWPNTIHYCRRNNIPVVLANARLSEKSRRGYRRLAALAGPMLRNLSSVVAQTADDADRFKSLGLPPETVSVSGSIKFDIELDAGLRQRAAELKQQYGDSRPIWVAASTHQGEDEILLQAFTALLQTFPELLLILVPRHPERFDRVAGLAQQRGFRVQRRSQAPIPSGDTQVVVGDTMGELLLLYGLGDIAFVGGSLVENGGHNMLEAAAWELPIITGPSDFNFRAISDMLQRRGGLVKVRDASAMADQLQQWLASDDKRRAAGEAAARVVAENRGALNRLLAEVERWI